MSASWNHTLVAMTDEHAESYARRGWTCSAPKCPDRAVFEARFDSVTGRAGRVNTRRKCLCDRHAEQFATKNGLTVPNV